MSIPMVARKKIIIIIGTRPEVIKLAPVYMALRQRGECKVIVCKTGQHKELADPMFSLFKLSVNYDLDVMHENQSLSSLASRLLERVDDLLVRERPDWVVVQGDTTSAMVCAMAAFYHQLPIAHVEAGLRTHNMYAPFPEEINRVIVDHLATQHFAPTEAAKKALMAEGISEETIQVTGNTIVDSLHWCIEKHLSHYTPIEFKSSELNKPFVLVTTHRRENFGHGITSICGAVADFAAMNPASLVVWPVHLNPNVNKTVREMVGRIANIMLLPPVSYLTLLWMLQHCHLVLSDSGGIQEEAPSFKKPVLVLRNETERLEGIRAGVARLVGTDRKMILSQLNALWNDRKAYSKMVAKSNPYGDGQAAMRIAKKLCGNIRRKSVTSG